MDVDSFDGLTIGGDLQVWGTQPAPASSQREAFLAAFEEAFGYEATGFPAAEAAYDAVYVLALAAAAANANQGTAIRDHILFVANSPGLPTAYGSDGFSEAIDTLDELQDVNYIGASGQVDFDGSGAIAKGAVQTWRLIGSQIAPIETRDVDVAAEAGVELPVGARAAATEAPSESMVIGLLVTDDDAGTAIRDAARLAVDEIIAAGGVNGEPVELAEVTLGEDVAEGARSLIEDLGATAIVGPTEAGAVSEAIAVAAAAGVPVLALSPAPELAVVEDGEFLFSVVASEALQMAALARLAVENEARNVCVLYEQGGAGEVMAAAFKQAIEFKGAAVRDSEPFDPGQDDFGALLDRCLGS
jgi:ABC-type branched-subunit amino acid transport system substrate-binding protein